MNKLMQYLGLATLCAAAGCTTVQSSRDLPAVQNFDAAKYMGTWHEVARLPQWFERDLKDVTATYSLEKDSLRIVNRGTKNGKEKVAKAVGHFAGDSDVGHFRISFFRPFYGDYKILWLSPGYDLSLVTGNDRSSLWLLSRNPNLPVEQRDALIDMAKGMGFKVEELEFP